MNLLIFGYLFRNLQIENWHVHCMTMPTNFSVQDWSFQRSFLPYTATPSKIFRCGMNQVHSPEWRSLISMFTHFIKDPSNMTFEKEKNYLEAYYLTLHFKNEDLC